MSFSCLLINKQTIFLIFIALISMVYLKSYKYGVKISSIYHIPQSILKSLSTITMISCPYSFLSNRKKVIFNEQNYCFGLKSNVKTSTSLLSSPKSIDRKEKSMKEVYYRLLERFTVENVSEPESSAQYLLCDVTKIGYRYSDFVRLLQDSMTLTSEQERVLEIYAIKRCNHMPIQYIIGNWDFFGMTLYCEPPILIPRPETEELIQLVIDNKILDHISSPKILDIGVGTGAIGLALLKQYPTATCVGIDIHPIAVNLARKNAKFLALDSRYTCLEQSFQDYVLTYSQIDSRDGYDLIISNPPYIPTKEMSELQPEVGNYEDHKALHGGIDGLDLIRDIIRFSPSLLRSTGSREIWMEVARQHPKIIQEWIYSTPSLQNKYPFVESIQDLSGHPRFSRLRATLF